MPEIALAGTELLKPDRHTAFADRYHSQYTQTLTWLKQALGNAARERDTQRTHEPACQETQRHRLAELTGFVRLLDSEVTSVTHDPITENVAHYCLTTRFGLGFCGMVLDPPDGRLHGMVISAWGNDGPAIPFIQSYLGEGLRVVLPYLARMKRSFADHPERRWVQFHDAELLHLYYFIVGGSLCGLEAAEINCVAAHFSQGRDGPLSVALELGGRHTLTATVTAALAPLLPERSRPNYRLLVLDETADRLDHQEADVRANTVWNFHRHFDALALFELARPAQLLFVESMPTPSIVYSRAAAWFSNTDVTLMRQVKPEPVTLAGAIVSLLRAQSESAPDEQPSATMSASIIANAIDTEASAQHYLDALTSKLDFLQKLHCAATARKTTHYALETLTPEEYSERVEASVQRVAGLPVPEAQARYSRTCLVGSFAAYDVYATVLTSVPGIDTAGYLLLPRTIEPQPAVICQHGLGGRPETLIGLDEGLEGGWVYDRFAQRLAEKGYVVFAPFMNWGWAPTAARDALVKHAFALGRMPNRFEVAQLHAVVDFLQTRSEVMADRIAFYGLSYGGHASLWLCAQEPRLRAVITAGHFNDWQRKLTSLELSPPLVRPTSYISVDEGIDMFNYNVLEELGHAELATRYAPRPYMVENGLQDTVSPTAWVDQEFARVQAVFDWFDHSSSVQLEHFNGPHRVWAEGSFHFLHRHLRQIP